MTGFHIAESTESVSLSLSICETMKRYPQFFRDDVKIASFFGSPAVKWNGGRLMVGNFYENQIRAAVECYNSYGVPYRFTFTNPHITEEMLEDKRGNFLLDLADNGLNEVIVNSPILENYIRKTHPKIKLTSSTCKCIRDIDDVKRELEKDYSLVVLDYNFNNNFEELEKLTPEERKRCELLINTFCIPNCPRRSQHYDVIGKTQIRAAAELEKYPTVNLQTMAQIKVDEWQCDYHGGNPYEAKRNSLWIGPDALFEKYVPMGFENFKIEGRRANMMYVADEAARYIAKPECFNEAVFYLMKGATENKQYNYV